MTASDDDLLRVNRSGAALMAGLATAALAAAAILTARAGGSENAVVIATIGYVVALTGYASALASALRARSAHRRGGRGSGKDVLQCVAVLAMLSLTGPMLASMAVPPERMTHAMSAWFQADRIAMICAACAFGFLLISRNRRPRAADGSRPGAPR